MGNGSFTQKLHVCPGVASVLAAPAVMLVGGGETEAPAGGLSFTSWGAGPELLAPDMQGLLCLLHRKCNCPQLNGQAGRGPCSPATAAGIVFQQRRERG